MPSPDNLARDLDKRQIGDLAGLILRNHYGNFSRKTEEQDTITLEETVKARKAALRLARWTCLAAYPLMEPEVNVRGASRAPSALGSRVG